MKMKNNGANVFWIDNNYSIRSEFISSSHLKSGANYISEAIWMTDNAEHVEVIPANMSANNKEVIERLKVKAEEMRNSALYSGSNSEKFKK
jgi:hypothetical protein